jgi:hypothetical protein
METVRLPDAAEFGPEDQKIFDNTRQWFRIDFVPKMSRVLRMLPAPGDGIMRAMHYHKITDVEVSQSPLERAVDLQTLEIFTAGTPAWNPGSWQSRAEVSFPGLPDAETPERLVHDALKGYRATGQ